MNSPIATFAESSYSQYMRRQTVTSLRHSIKQLKNNPLASKVSKRIIFFLVACCIQMIYIPTSSRVTGGIEPKLTIDTFPIYPVWVVPYVLCYPLWFAGVMWVIMKMEDRLFRSFIAACIFTFALGTTIFVFFPTYVPSATLIGNDIFTNLLRFLHQDWGRYDAFPSGHIYITTLLMLYYNRWYPRQILVWILLVVIISLSTLFTGQHYFLDVIGGYAVAFAGYHFGLWWAGFYSTPGHSNKQSGKRIVSSSLR